MSLHRRVLKNLFRKFFPDSSCLFNSANVLKLGDVYRFRVSEYMYKVIRMNLYASLRQSLPLHYPSHGCETSNRGNIVFPFPRTESIRQNFQYQFITIWNSIPIEIRNETSLSKFKSSLKSYFMSFYH